MRKLVSLIVVIVLMAMVMMAGTAGAEIKEIPQIPEKKVDTLVVFKTNLINPPKGESKVCNQTTIYFQGQKFGLGMDTASVPKTNYLNLNPYATLKVGTSPMQIVAGYWTDSAGADFIHEGIWYAPKIGDTKVFLEIREYTAIDGKSRDYLDNFLEVVYPIGEKVDAGINVVYDRWWSGKDRDFVQAGPILYYQVTKALKLFVRPTRETGSVDKVRFGIKFVF